MTADRNQRLGLMQAFAQTYRDRQFDADHYDLDGGYLQTTLSDDSRMPLRFFVEYNNAWWFEIVTAVEVPAVGYDPDSDTGFIVLDIAYDDDILCAMQHVGFGADGRIDRIRTYASNTFFQRARPLIELDTYGNQLWLETGYHLRPSALAAMRFLDSPAGQRFAVTEATAAPMARIRRNLDQLLRRI